MNANAHTRDHTEYRIAVITPHALTRWGLTAIIDDHDSFEIVGRGSDGDHIARMASHRQPDVMLVDANLIDSPDARSVQQTIQRHTNVRFLVVTATDRAADIERYFALGATGVVTNDANSADYVQAIRHVGRGVHYLHPQLGVLLARHADRDSTLTERELRVAELIALGHTNSEIGRSLYVSRRTVESHRSHIKAKLGFATRSDFVRWALDARLIGPETNQQNHGTLRHVTTEV